MGFWRIVAVVWLSLAVIGSWLGRASPEYHAITYAVAFLAMATADILKAIKDAERKILDRIGRD